MGTSKRERKFKDKNENMDTQTNKTYKVMINGTKVLKYSYDSYYAASKAGENFIKDTNDYYDVMEN